MVSDYAQFRELPDDVTLKVPLGDDEVPALVARLAALLAAPERLETMGRAAREHVARRHDPAAAAEAVIAACTAWAEAEPPGDRPAAPPPPTSLTWSPAGRITVDGAARPWPEGERRLLRVTLTNSGPARWLAAWRGEGGIALRLGLDTPEGDLLAARPWLPLPRDLAPGESHLLEVAVRRPPGPARLRLDLQEAGAVALPALREPTVHRGPIVAPAPAWTEEI